MAGRRPKPHRRRTGPVRLDAVRDIVGRVWPFIAGIAVGALVHGYVPARLLASSWAAAGGRCRPPSLIGIPMYSNAAGIIPVVEALLAKGAALGTVLAFMMRVIALSLPEMIILRKVLKIRLIAAFAAGRHRHPGGGFPVQRAVQVAIRRKIMKNVKVLGP